MPRQLNTGRAPFTSASKTSTPKATRKHKQRGLDAFAIASAEDPEQNGLKRHRLGELDQSEGPRSKKRRSGDNDDLEDDGDGDNGSGSERDSREQRRSKQRSRDDEGLDNSEGSDSEGNEWRMGRVSDDEDEELDSDEAFGESDEEKFEGFTFRGSSSHNQKPKTRRHTSSGFLDLDENEGVISDESDSDSLGEDAVDLATVLDQDQEEESEGESEEDEESEDQSMGFSSEDEGDSDNEDRLQRLQDLVTSLPRHAAEEAEDDEDTGDAQISRERLLSALRGMSNLDPAFSRSAKRLADGAAATSQTAKSSALVKAPLPKRQQDRLDREAAYVKAKETLNRWIDTVKHNRRAEHLSFPLKDPQAQEALGASRMLAAGGDDEPRNELERAIQTIMQESGLASARGPKDEEAQIREAEDLQAKKMPLEEVMARRTELRKQRDLLFREEIRARRIKKIKSKAYRRVHRKEKEKLAQKDADLLAVAGLDDSEEERERNDRRRAEERMGARHRDSKWAKGIKKSGRGAWDDDARAGVTDMARRNEDLRKRIEGRKVRGSHDDSAGISGDESDDDGSDDDDENDGFKLRDALDRVERNESDAKTGLSSMKFMQRADAARKRENDEAVAALRRTMEADDEGENESEDEARPIGRRSFGPTQAAAHPSRDKTRRNELEEGSMSDSDSVPLAHERDPPKQKSSEANIGSTRRQTSTSKAVAATKATSKHAVKSMQQSPSRDSDHDVDPIKPADLVRKVATPSDTTGWEKVHVKGSKPPKPKQMEAVDEAGEEPLVLSNTDLVRAAFGGDEDEADFEADKRAMVVDEDEKTISNALPGWGSWVGDGMSKAQQKRNKPRNQTTKVEGVKATDRKDAKLQRVILSEKRMKKNAKYLAPTLPHPFESRQQYERSLRVPIGPEWTTKESFQSATKPRIMVKQGIIKPMERPSI